MLLLLKFPSKIEIIRMEIPLKSITVSHNIHIISRTNCDK